MITSPQVTSTVDPTEGLVQYVQAIKPYHTKILEVLVEYVYTDKILATVQDKMVSTLTTLPSDIVHVPNPFISTSIGEQFGFDIHLDFRDDISASLVDIRPVGYGMDPYSTPGGSFGSPVDPDGLSITVVGSGGTAFTGSITGTTLTVTAIAGVLTAGQTILSEGVTPVAANTIIVNQLTGTIGGIGTYTVSVSQSVASEPMTTDAGTFTLPVGGLDLEPFDE